MAIVELNDSNFEQETETNSVPVLVDFWAGATRSHTNTIPQRIELCGR